MPTAGHFGGGTARSGLKCAMATHQVGCLGAQGEGGGGFWSVRFLGVDNEYRGGARPGRRRRGYPAGHIQHTAAGTVTYQVCNFPPEKKRAVLVFGSCGSGVWITNAKWNSVGGNAAEGVRRAALGLGRRVKIQPASANDSRGQRNF